jgi:hypothetical protein
MIKLEQFLADHLNKPIVLRPSGHSRLMDGEWHWEEYTGTLEERHRENHPISKGQEEE